MKWNQEIFNKNIDFLIQEKCGGVQQVFNDIVGPRDAATAWKKRMPSFKYILTICDKFDCSLDWLIKGKEYLKRDAEHRKAKENMNSIHRARQPILYGVLDVIVESDRPDAITAVVGMLRGILLMIGESSDTKELRRLNKLLEQLLESHTPPKKRSKPAPDAGT